MIDGRIGPTSPPILDLYKAAAAAQRSANATPALASGGKTLALLLRTTHALLDSAAVVRLNIFSTAHLNGLAAAAT